MSFFSKLVGGGGGNSGSNRVPVAGPPSALDQAFARLRPRCGRPAVYTLMLPVFCKVYSSLPSSEMSASFPDVGQFCSHGL
uniref:Uncharacterized protein n=1 Tax=Macrostomum lignano TaxID=282301 RepID=A0A1I8F4B8_9PLAT